MADGEDGANGKIIDKVREYKPDYVLWLADGTGFELRQETLAEIKKTSKVIGWFTDDEVRFDSYSKLWVPYLDYVVTGDIEAVPKYNELGAWATFGVCTCYPIERKFPPREKYAVSFVGTARADRGAWISYLRNIGIPLGLFGDVTHKEMTDIFWDSKINLNFSRTYDFKTLGMKARVFEVCLAGGFLLTQDFPQVERYYEIGKEADVFRDKEEMVEKIAYYLNHPEKRRAIAEAGYKRAKRDYSSTAMVSRIMREIEGSQVH